MNRSISHLSEPLDDDDYLSILSSPHLLVFRLPLILGLNLVIVLFLVYISCVGVDLLEQKETRGRRVVTFCVSVYYLEEWQ